MRETFWKNSGYMRREFVNVYGGNGGHWRKGSEKSGSCGNQ